MGVRLVAGASPEAGVEVVHVPRSENVSDAASRLRELPGVAFAVPNYIAHIAGAFIPDDPGNTRQPEGWEKLQWNFLATAGVDAPDTWANLIADHRAGGRGVVVAVLDTGVAYRNWRRFRRSPDFAHTRFRAPYDFVAHNRFPVDRQGHGTFIAGEIAESTNNNFGLTGLAYGVTIMPIRVLAADGTGDAATIARGIRYAVKHGAQVINLSLEFGIGINAADIPAIVRAIRFAHRHGVVIVGAAGNDQAPEIAYPARAPYVIAVGATTKDRCLAWYSDVGRGLALVAPGGDDDATLPSNPDCHPGRNLPPIYQLTLIDPNRRRFGYPSHIYGTSMAAAQVAAAAALVIASGVAGEHPSPETVLKRLELTAQPLGTSPRPNWNYGYGLVDAAAATAPDSGSGLRSRH
jgi:serine protease